MFAPHSRLLVLGLALVAGPSRLLGHAGIDQIEAAASALVAAEPDSWQRLIEQALVYRAGGKWDRALAAIEHAADHGAPAERVHTERGLVFLEAGWPHAAIVEIDRALAATATKGTLLFARGRAYRQLGRADSAAADMAAGVATMKRPTPEHYFELRDTYMAVGDRAAAVAALDSAAERLGTVPSIELAALALEEEASDWPAALRRVDRLLRTNPRNEAWVARRGDILGKSGRDAEAEAAYRHALELIDARPAQRRGRRIDALRVDLSAKLREG